MTTPSSLARSYELPHGFRVSFSYGCGSLGAQWSPASPRIRQARQRRKFLEAYRAARREFLQEIAATIGGSVLVVDTDQQMTCEEILAPTRH